MKMGYKTFGRMVDLAADFVRFPCDETDRALQDFQDSIRWPWSATQEQLNDWSESWKHSWDANLAGTIDAQKEAGIWPVRTREDAVAFAKTHHNVA